MRIAIVGTGISGLGAAYLLSRAHDVEIFEREPRAGGHTNTFEHRGLGLDTGFLVHNEPNYPLLGKLFRELGVRTQPSEMSFSVGCDACGLEYSGRRPFSQPANALQPRFHGLLWEIGRWLRTARRSLDEVDYESHTLLRYLDERGYSQRFREHFIVPLTSALWSTAPGRALEFPAAHAIRFFDHHGMLGFRRFRWLAVTGGSRTYVDALLGRLAGRVRLGLGVRAIERRVDGVDVIADDGERRAYDGAVIATHADQALRLLADPSEDERRVLGGLAYTTNEAVLHTDGSFLPRAPAARASWNYRVGDEGHPTLTYYLNRLQRLDAETDYCVTLNEPVPEQHVLARFSYDHPLYTLGTIAAQRELPSLAGRRRTWYAGAHHGNGFHEDGLASGVRAAAALGVPW